MKWCNRNSGTEVITFRAQSEHVWQVRERPKPASKCLPNWWKDMPHFSNSTQDLRLDPGPTVTVKRCLSALDALSAGYIVPLWADLLVTTEVEGDKTAYARWNTSAEVLRTWPDNQVSTFELPDGYDKVVFKYMHGWTIKTPPGWSCLITHPIAHPNLPFRVISGIIDTDLLETDINTPFVFKKGFNGILEAGTPMFQIIPIKRNNWKSEFQLEEPNQFDFNTEKLRSKIVSYYGRYLRKPKVFQ